MTVENFCIHSMNHFIKSQRKESYKSISYLRQLLSVFGPALFGNYKRRFVPLWSKCRWDRCHRLQIPWPRPVSSRDNLWSGKHADINIHVRVIAEAGTINDRLTMLVLYCLKSLTVWRSWIFFNLSFLSTFIT